MPSLKLSAPMRDSTLSGVTSEGGIPAVAWACAVWVALPVKRVTAMAPANVALINVRLVVFIVIVDYRPNDTVSVFAHSPTSSPSCRFGISPSIGLWGNIPLESVFISHALVAATEATARDAGVGHGCSWHPDDINEQRTSSPISWRSAFKNARVVGKIITGQLGVAKLHHQVRYVITTKDRERGVRVVLKEAVLSMTPQRNELACLHMPGHARRTISEGHGHWVNSAKDQLSFVESHIPRVLHEEDIHFV